MTSQIIDLREVVGEARADEYNKHLSTMATLFVETTTTIRAKFPRITKDRLLFIEIFNLHVKEWFPEYADKITMTVERNPIELWNEGKYGVEIDFDAWSVVIELSFTDMFHALARFHLKEVE